MRPRSGHPEPHCEFPKAAQSKIGYYSGLCGKTRVDGRGDQEGG